MDEETRARIFEPFFTTKETGRGTGLGLYMVSRIVAQIGGHLQVASQRNRGSTFTIYLPAAAKTEEPITAEGTAPEMELPGGSETILLVEDDESLRRVAENTLRREGYAVVSACDGTAGLEALKAHSGTIHLVLTDMVMPGMGGGELTRKVRELRSGMRVLCMSGYTETALTRNEMTDTSTGFIDKPFTPSALLRKVREMLDT
jgi:two-component system cell cycle sensor histidine kinase/response regulator CckA